MPSNTPYRGKRRTTREATTTTTTTKPNGDVVKVVEVVKEEITEDSED